MTTMQATFEAWNRAAFAALAAGTAPSPASLAFARALANWAIYATPVALVALWLAGGTARRRAAVGAAASGVLALASGAAAGAAFVHARPVMLGLSPNFLDHAPDNSFPSDHATLAFAVAFALWSAGRRGPAAALTALGAAIGWARVFLGAHFPADVLGAAAIALVCAPVFAQGPGRAVRDLVADVGERIWDGALARVGARRRSV
ncbi:MAG: phosphatase PAP2 family protein [Hyphomicrobiales bacterium]|nr:phosphatase PAP2 family protein [Hyphomicrobiales bacterium]